MEGGRPWLVLLLVLQVCLGRLDAALVRASGPQDLELLFRENLEPDFKPYHEATYQVSNLLHMLQQFSQGRPKHLTILVIKQGLVTPVRMTKAPQPALSAKRVQFIVEGLNNATRQGMQLQDTVLLLNTWDEPRCGSKRSPVPCTVPVFSLIKQWDWEAGRGLQGDVLVPFFSHFYGDIISHPWQEKTPKGLMRAAAQNGMHRNCTRLWLLELAKTPEGQRLLDVGITNNQKKGLHVEIADYVDIPSHAKWKYLLSTDGFTASCRFGKLLQTDSVVLKERSSWIEYYYRSVKPDVHYYEFNKDNVLQVLQALEDSDKANLQQVTAAAQEFGYKHLSQFAKALYFGKAVEMYNSRFADVKQLMSGLEPEGMDVGALLAAMQAHVGKQT